MPPTAQPTRREERVGRYTVCRGLATPDRTVVIDPLVTLARGKETMEAKARPESIHLYLPVMTRKRPCKMTIHRIPTMAKGSMSHKTGYAMLAPKDARLVTLRQQPHTLLPRTSGFPAHIFERAFGPCCFGRSLRTTRARDWRGDFRKRVC